MIQSVTVRYEMSRQIAGQYTSDKASCELTIDASGVTGREALETLIRQGQARCLDACSDAIHEEELRLAIGGRNGQKSA